MNAPDIRQYPADGERTVTVDYDPVSVAAWTIVGALGIVIGFSVLVSSSGSGGSWTWASVITLAGAGATSYLLQQWWSRKPRLVIDADGLHDWRSGREITVPWSSVERVRYTRGRGRRRIALTLADDAMVRIEWPFWMKGWAYEGRDVLVSDWLVRLSLADIAEAIRKVLPEPSVFESDLGFREAVQEARDWWTSRRRPRS